MAPSHRHQGSSPSDHAHRHQAGRAHTPHAAAHHTRHARRRRPLLARGLGRRAQTGLWIAVALAAMAAAYPEMRRIPQSRSGVHFREIRAAVDRWGPWAPAAGFVIMVAHVFIPLPGEIVLAVMGAAFGFWRGLAISWTGNVVGAVIAFELGRALGPNRRPRTVSAKALKWVDSHIRQGDWRTALVIRFVPLVPVSVFNFALGRTAVPFFTFLWTSAAGFLPLTAVVVAFGYGATGAQDVLPWAVAALAAMIAGGLMYRYRIARTGRA
jgi:uncharacterized membrane protein YdjX (TVP38/TMEM64 family)